MAIRKPRGFAGFFDAAAEAYGEGREEWAKAYREGRKAKGASEDAPRWDEMTGAYPTGIRMKELIDDVRGKKLTKSERDNRAIRDDLGIGIKSGFGPRTGQLLGTVAADLTQDNTRNFYWLLNAAQATGNVIAEKAMGLANKSLYGKSPVMGADGAPLTMKSARKGGDIDAAGAPRKGISIGEGCY